MNSKRLTKLAESMNGYGGMEVVYAFLFACGWEFNSHSDTDYEGAMACLEILTKRFFGLAKIDYPVYLKTKYWETRSIQAKERAGWRCSLCNKEGELHTHHRTYERLGYEDDEDLIVLCAACHAKYHDKD